jgi:hypothetical protein
MVGSVALRPCLPAQQALWGMDTFRHFPPARCVRKSHIENPPVSYYYFFLIGIDWKSLETPGIHRIFNHRQDNLYLLLLRETRSHPLN